MNKRLLNSIDSTQNNQIHLTTYARFCYVRQEATSLKRLIATTDLSATLSDRNVNRCD